MTRQDADRVVGLIGQVSEEIDKRLSPEFGSAGIVVARAEVVDAPGIGELQGVQQLPQIRGGFAVPVSGNEHTLNKMGGAFACVVRDGELRPGVITPLESGPGVRVTCLAERFDPRYAPTALQLLLLEEIIAVQNPRAGGDHVHGERMGNELGHAIMAVTGILKPESVSGGGHPVHVWTKSDEGIAGVVSGHGLFGFADRPVRQIPVWLGKVDHLVLCPHVDDSLREMRMKLKDSNDSLESVAVALAVMSVASLKDGDIGPGAIKKTTIEVTDRMKGM